MIPFLSEDGPSPARQVACPECGCSVEVSPVTVLHPGDSDLELLFTGELNCVACPECGISFALSVPVLFINEDEKFFVYFVPLEAEGDWADAEKTMKLLIHRLLKDQDGVEEPELRLVTNRGDFIEKIALHLRGFEDRLIEYVKYQLMNNPHADGKIDVVRHKLLYDFSRENDENLAFIVFDRETNQPTAGMHLSLEDFREITDMFVGDEGLDDELRKLFPGYYVSVDRLQSS